MTPTELASTPFLFKKSSILSRCALDLERSLLDRPTGEVVPAVARRGAGDKGQGAEKIGDAHGNRPAPTALRADVERQVRGPVD